MNQVRDGKNAGIATYYLQTVGIRSYGGKPSAEFVEQALEVLKKEGAITFSQIFSESPTDLPHIG